MVPHFRHHKARALFALTAIAGCLTASFGRAASGAPVDVMVSGQGTPVAGVKVTLAPDAGGAPESWSPSNSKALAVIATDPTGHAVFADVPTGKYIITTSCGLPGNWIAGNYATRIETLPGRPANLTLTLRRGSMLRGKTWQGSVPAGHAEIRADSPDALMSTCGMMTPSLVDTTSGAFTVTKIPLNATTWVKGELEFGPGRLGVWKDFHFEKPETLDVDLKFPEMGPKDVGSLILDFKPDTAEKPDSGTAQLLQVTPNGAWRYEASVGVGGVNGPVTVRNLPSGAYQIRSFAIPGASKWWSAPIESLTVVPGKVIRHTIKVSIRT